MCTYATGNLHFVKFETSKIGQCLDFIKSKNLHHCPDNGQGEKPQMRVQATGGGAFKYADMFQVINLSPSAFHAPAPAPSAPNTPPPSIRGTL